MDKLKSIYRNTLAIKDAMLNSSQSEENVVGKYTSFPVFLRKFQELRNLAKRELDLSIVDSFDYDRSPNPSALTWPEQKQIFDMVLANLNLLIARIETELDMKKDKFEELRNFLQNSIRKGAIEEVDSEKDIQNIIETLLIGKGLEKGIDYDREVGRVKISSKEVIPDFNLDRLSLAIEVKYTSSKTKTKSIIDEINADIRAYSKVYKYLLFIVYDKGTIRDEVEFKKDLESQDGTHLIIIKH